MALHSQACTLQFASISWTFNTDRMCYDDGYVIGQLHLYVDFP